MNAGNPFSLPVLPMKKKTVEFSSHTGNLALMRCCVRDFLNGYPFSEKERLLMVLGVDEACTNIIRYAYRLREDQPIALSMEGLRKCVRMRLRDYGVYISSAGPLMMWITCTNVAAQSWCSRKTWMA